MGSSHEKRPPQGQSYPFDSQGGAATQKVGSPMGSGETPGSGPAPAMGPTAGAGPGSATPFMGLYDGPAGPAPASQAPAASGGGNDPHVTLFTGITEDQTEAQAHAATLNQNAGSYAGYDTSNPCKEQPSWAADAALDATAVVLYSQVGNQVDLVPARDANGKIQYDANGNVKYDIDYGLLAGVPFPLMGEKYQSAKDLGQSGADAVLTSDSGHPPAKNEPIVIDAHSGGGQTAFFTVLELYQQGYTDINVVGFDMAMTPEQRSTLEKIGVDVTNATSHIDVNAGPLVNQGGVGSPLDLPITSPMATLIKWGMGGANSPYYDTNLEISSSDVNSQEGLVGDISEWHGFKDNNPSLEYMQQQNINQSNSKPTQARPDFFSSDINAKDKSASIDIGGPKGLGAYINLSEGQLDLNAFGKHVDIDQSARNAARTVTRAVDKAKDLGQDASEWVQDKWQAADTWVQDKAHTASSWVQDKTHEANSWVQDKTQAASTWVQDKTQAAGNWLQDTTSAVGGWLFGGNQSAGSKGGQAMSSGALGGAKAGGGSKAGAAMSSGALGGAKAGGGSSASPVAGPSEAAAKPTASKAAGSKGTVVTAPKDSAGGAASSSSKTGSAGKAADDVVGSKSGTGGGTSGGKSATQIPPSTAPKSGAGQAASPSKPGSATLPKSPTSPGKAADDIAPKSSGSKPAKSSSKALDHIAPKNSGGGSRGKDNRSRFS